MDYPKYQINFMPESYYGYCSTACFMGILNYFRYTQFNMKDTRDVMKIAKMGRYKFGVGLDECEMAYALSRLGFKVIYVSSWSYENDLAYLEDPVWYIAKKYENHPYKEYIKDGVWVDMNGNNSFELYDTYITQKILETDEIEKIYNVDLVSIVEHYQNDDTLFIFPLNRYVLYDQPHESGISGGHIVLCKGYKDGRFEIYDPGPYPKPDFIPKERVLNAMTELDQHYDFIVVRNT